MCGQHDARSALAALGGENVTQRVGADLVDERAEFLDNDAGHRVLARGNTRRLAEPAQ